MREKYIVFTTPPGIARPEMALDPGTYFVIRESDLLGHSVLWAYLGAVQTLREAARAKEGLLTPEEEQTLTGLEDHVQDLAERWQRGGKGRLPT